MDSGHHTPSDELLDIIESPPDTSHEALNISVRFHIIKIREIRAVHNVADLIFVAVQTWKVPRMKKYFEDNPAIGLPLSQSTEQLWAPPLIILNADSLASSPSPPSVDWLSGVCHRKTYFNGTVTNEVRILIIPPTSLPLTNTYSLAAFS
jgi:hypothetical protein